MSIASKGLAEEIPESRSKTTPERQGTILVFRDGEAWKIEANGKSYGTYREEEGAIWDAVSVAMKLTEGGQSVSVKLNTDGRAETIWPRPSGGQRASR
jgi:hypothetical protein